MKNQEYALNLERTFGVEIETIAVSDKNTQNIINEIRQQGVEINLEGYNHNDNQTSWKIVTDSSITRSRYGYGHEFVSPILKGQNGLDQIKIVCGVLNKYNVKVDKTCGLHVHHDARDFTLNTFKSLYTLYAKYESVIDSIMPTSRRGRNNEYCDTLIVNNDSEILFEKIKKSKSVEEMREIWNTRYIKLNMESFVRHGTIEFRQHSGTIDAEKIINWILLTNFMVEKCVNHITLAKSRVESTLKSFLHSIGFDRKANKIEKNMLKKYYGKRIEELA